MTTYSNPDHEKRLVHSTQFGEIRFLNFVFDFAQDYAPATIEGGDLIQIGIVPAGHRMVPQLSRAAIPALETDGGSPTGDYTVGTELDPDALLPTGAAQTARAIFGEDWTLSNVVGSATEDTPIYIAVTAGEDVTTPLTSGSVIVEMALRAWDQNYDE